MGGSDHLRVVMGGSDHLRVVLGGSDHLRVVIGWSQRITFIRFKIERLAYVEVGHEPKERGGVSSNSTRLGFESLQCHEARVGSKVDQN